MSHTLQVPDGTLGFDDTGGDGRLLVAAPGMGDTRQVYRHLIPEVRARGLRMVTMDLRGMGSSSVDWPDYSDAAVGSDMLALVRHLDAGPAVLVGNSLTASSAVIAAVEEPDAVTGLVLVGPFARNVETPGWQNLLFRTMLTPPWGKSAWTSYYRKQMYPGAKPPDHDDYVSELNANLSENGRYAAFRALAFNSHEESGSKLASVACPALVIMGTADPDFPDPEAEARGLAEILGAELVLIEGAGHYPQAEEPFAVAVAIADFVAGLD
jgi:pimeloyl-ACP methyl ester carboxylesterase